MKMGSRPSVDDMRDFAVFADLLNFTRAAEQLHVSQPALHVKVRKLAEAIDRPLYVREGRRLVLTPEGDEVARLGRQAEHLLADLLGRFEETPEPVTLAAGEGTYLYVIGQAVRRLLAAGHQLRLVNTDAATAIEAVRTGDADVAVAVADRVPRSLDAIAVASYPQVLAMPVEHSLAQRRTVRLSDLDGVALIVPPPGRALRSSLQAALRGSRVRWEVAVEAEGWHSMLRFVSLGVGLAVVNGCVTAPDGVVTRSIDDLPEVCYSAMFSPGATDRAEVVAVLDALRASAP
jgi:DNA-binding transcriptional LysR family regulator